MYWHPRDWTLGAWLAVAYITLFLGSVLAGFTSHAGYPAGLALGYAIAFLIAVLAFSGGGRGRPS